MAASSLTGTVAKAMIPEKYIERLPFKSACLNHGHSDDKVEEVPGTVDESTTARAAEAAESTDQDVEMGDPEVQVDAETPVQNDNDDSQMDIVDGDDEVVEIVSPASDPAAEVPAKTKTKKPEDDEIDWDNDPAYQYFCRRLDQQKHLRQHRLHPVSKFQIDPQEECKGCRDMILPLVADGKSKLPQHRPLTAHNWHLLKHRYEKTLSMLHDEDHDEDRICPVCKESFRRLEGTVSEHWAIHHNNFVHHICEDRDLASARASNPEDAEVSSPTNAGASSSEPEAKFEFLIEHEVNPAEMEEGALWTREEFRYMEKLWCYAENEVLQREEYCRLCYETFEYGDPALVDHYKWHSQEEQTVISLVNKNTERTIELLDNAAVYEDEVVSPKAAGKDDTVVSNNTIDGDVEKLNARQKRARAANDRIRATYDRAAENRRRTQQFNAANVHQINFLPTYIEEVAPNPSELVSPALHDGLVDAVKWPGNKSTAANKKKLSKRQAKAAGEKAKAAAKFAEAEAEQEAELQLLAEQQANAVAALAAAKAEVERKKGDIRSADARVAAIDVDLTDEDDEEESSADSTVKPTSPKRVTKVTKKRRATPGKRAKKA